MVRVQQIIEFSQFSVVNAKFRGELWIYKIMTSVFDTHPPLIYVIILGFETSTHPPIMTMSLKFTVFFEGFPYWLVDG